MYRKIKRASLPWGRSEALKVADGTSACPYYNILKGALSSA